MTDQTNHNKTFDLLEQMWDSPTYNKNTTPGKDIDLGSIISFIGVILCLVALLVAISPVAGAVSHFSGQANLTETQVYAVDSAYTASHNLTKALAPVLGNQVYSGITTTAKQLPNNNYILTLTSTTGLITTYNSRTKKYDSECTQLACVYSW